MSSWRERLRPETVDGVSEIPGDRRENLEPPSERARQALRKKRGTNRLLRIAAITAARHGGEVISPPLARCVRGLRQTQSGRDGANDSGNRRRPVTAVFPNPPDPPLVLTALFCSVLYRVELLESWMCEPSSAARRYPPPDKRTSCQIIDAVCFAFERVIAVWITPCNPQNE